MKYDFDTPVQRRGTHCMKWDEVEQEGVIPMWVADMDFHTAPAVRQAVERRAAHGVFGYTHVPEEYYQAVTGWFSRRHGWDISRDWIVYTSGVVPAISAVIKALTSPGDGVLIQTPVYNCFFSSIRNNGCHAVDSPLVYSGGTYHIDFDDLEAKAAQPDVKLFLLCNPHNPAGRVWRREELLRMADICRRHGLTVVSDEIHCELVMPGHKFIPFASLSDECQQMCITCNSPSKSFNTAGLQIANIISSNDSIRRRIDRAININEVCDVNPFGVEALISAYREGEDWLGELNLYLKSNYEWLRSYFAAHLPQCPVLTLEGTYLVWVDCHALGMKSDEIEQELLKEKVLINSGTLYGDTGEGFIRINIACPLARMQEGVRRIVQGLRRLL